MNILKKIIKCVFTMFGHDIVPTGEVARFDNLKNLTNAYEHHLNEHECVHKGFIEHLILTDVKLPKKVSFAYVDLDLYEPIKIALSFLNNVTSIGSIIGVCLQ